MQQNAWRVRPRAAIARAAGARAIASGRAYRLPQDGWGRMSLSGIMLLLHFCCVVPTAAAAGGTAGKNGSRTLLMVDDHELLYRAGLRRELEPLQRLQPGTAVIVPDQPWENLLGYVSVQEVDGSLMMWYQSYVAGSSGHINGSGCFVAVAYSSDRGTSWTKPALDILKTADGGKTNVVFAPGPSFYFGSVLHEPSAPPASRFKMVYWDLQLGPGPAPGNPPSHVPGLYTAVSPDGLRWTQQEPLGQPKIVGGYGDPGPVSWEEADPNHRPDAKGHWDTELSESDAMNLVWDPKMKECPPTYLPTQMLTGTLLPILQCAQSRMHGTCYP